MFKNNPSVRDPYKQGVNFCKACDLPRQILVQNVVPLNQKNDNLNFCIFIFFKGGTISF